MQVLRNVSRNKSENILGALWKNVRNQSTKERTVNSRHLKEGDALPPFSGTLRIYGMRYSPFAQRIAIVLNAKNVDYEVVNINLVNRPKWIYTKHPRGKIPSIEVSEGVTIHDSLLASEYIEDTYTEKRLKSPDPLIRAMDSTIIHFSNMLTKFFINSIRFRTSVDPEQVKMFFAYLDYTQDYLERRGTAFLHGDTPGFVDYMIWPWFERLPLIENDCVALWPFPEKYARLTQYLSNMRQDPAIMEHSVPEHLLHLFMRQFNLSYPKYDELDKLLEDVVKSKKLQQL